MYTSENNSSGSFAISKTWRHHCPHLCFIYCFWHPGHTLYSMLSQHRTIIKAALPHTSRTLRYRTTVGNKHNCDFPVTLKGPRQRGLAPSHERATAVLLFQGLIWKTAGTSINETSCVNRHSHFAAQMYLSANCLLRKWGHCSHQEPSPSPGNSSCLAYVWETEPRTLTGIQHVKSATQCYYSLKLVTVCHRKGEVLLRTAAVHETLNPSRHLHLHRTSS